MNFKNFYKEDYEAVCDFLIELNLENKDHINWNWARFEWMMKHPEFDESLIKSIGLWMDGEKVVGAAIYDMYFGEAFCGVLPEYEALYPEILAYAYRELRDDNGLGIAICDESEKEIEAAKHAGFSLSYLVGNVMFIGDAVPVKGDIPIFINEAATRNTLKTIRQIPNVKTYYPAWDKAYDYETMKMKLHKAEELINNLKTAVKRCDNGEDIADLVNRVCDYLKMPMLKENPLFARTIACLREERL